MQVSLSTEIPSPSTTVASLNPTWPLENEIRDLFANRKSMDPYKNCGIDLTRINGINDKNIQQTIMKIFSELLENKDQFNHLIVTICQKHHRLYKCLMKNDFEVHHSEDPFLVTVRCLGHQTTECAYPLYKTMSIGVTVVIFNQDLTEFLAVQEKSGPYKGWKAPTGGVDYKNEDELTAAVREVREETNLEISPHQLTLVGMAPTNNLRGRSPDRNFVYACKSDKTNEIKPQEKEIRKVEWISVNDFLTSKLPVNHESRPLVLQEVVRIAKKSLENKQGWKPCQAYWGSGRPAVLYQEKEI
jgi:8-oxo-dGTP pyrophosphatase MutT (NUDIX family)